MIESRLRGPRLCSPFSYGLWAWPHDILWPMRNFRYNASRWLKSACTLVLSSLFLNFFFGFVISCYFLHPSTIWGSPGKSTKWWDTHGPGTVAMQLKASISKWHQPNSSTSHLTFKRGHPRSPTDLPETTGAWGRPAEWSQANQTSRNAQMNNSILS